MTSSFYLFLNNPSTASTNVLASSRHQYPRRRHRRLRHDPARHLYGWRGIKSCRRSQSAVGAHLHLPSQLGRLWCRNRFRWEPSGGLSRRNHRKRRDVARGLWRRRAARDRQREWLQPVCLDGRPAKYGLLCQTSLLRVHAEACGS